jgi:sugar-specific transcriptional regulator TrmB
MSRERIKKALEWFNLSPVEFDVFIFLSKTGCSSAETLSSNLGITKKRLYPVLKKLEAKGIVTSYFAHVRLFSAITFGALLDQVINSDVEKTKIIEETKKEAIDNWRGLIKNDHSIG